MGRTFITTEDVARMAEGTAIALDERTTLTPPARDLARRRGFPIVEADGSEAPDCTVAGRAAAASAAAAVPVASELATRAPGSGPYAVHAHDATDDNDGRPPRTLIVTAVGVNRPGVMAELSRAVGQLGGDIQDVSQRITAGYFHAILIVDVSRASQGFKAFASALRELSEPSEYVVTVVDERVFRAMHRL